MRRHSAARAGRKCFRATKPFSPDISDDLRHAMQVLRARLQGNEPRVLGPTSFESWSLYTDASYEPDGTGGIGGPGSGLP